MLAAFVACRPGTSPAPEELQQWLAERLPSFLVPGMILMRESLPLTSSGKVDRKSLVLDPDQELPRMKGAQPGSETERLVAGAIAHVLGRDDISIDSRFFEMGLSSLDLVAVQAALGERLGTDIPLMTLLEHTSIRALAAWLDNRTPRTTAQEISAPEGAQTCPLFKKQICLRGTVKKAELRATAMGMYRFFIDGKDVTDALFMPGWTDYVKRVQVQTYDVTRFFACCKEYAELSLLLGNGWASAEIFVGVVHPYIPRAAAIAEYVSVPEDVTTCIVKDELLPPPCSACRMSAISRTFASRREKFVSCRSMCRMFSAVE